MLCIEECAQTTLQIHFKLVKIWYDSIETKQREVNLIIISSLQ